MNTTNIQHLANFHARYDTSEHVVMCEWCYKHIPSNQTTLVPIDIDPCTGMAVDEEVVCYDCLPPHDEGDSDWEYEADDGSWGTAKWT